MIYCNYIRFFLGQRRCYNRQICRQITILVEIKVHINQIKDSAQKTFGTV